MTPQTAAWAAEALPGIDPGRVRGRLAVGLRDGALLALLARGLTCAEVALLLCDQITIVERTGQVRLTARRPPWRCELVLRALLYTHTSAARIEQLLACPHRARPPIRIPEKPCQPRNPFGGSP